MSCREYTFSGVSLALLEHSILWIAILTEQAYSSKDLEQQRLIMRVRS